MEFKIDNKKIEILDNLIDCFNLVKRNNNVSNLGDDFNGKTRLFNRLFIKRIRQRKF